MRLTNVGYVLAQFLLVLGGAMLLPLPLAIWGTNDPSGPLLWACAATCACGAALLAACPRPRADLVVREALLLVVVVWLSTGFFGGLPFYFSPYFSSYTDAVFEAASGFTTTGATILADVEVLPRSLQLWRHFSHWMGGMGIVLLGIAVLPLLGTGGMHLYRAEFSGAKSEKLKPRITATAIALWKIYFALTFVLYVLLRLAGMDVFDAVCHAFSTLGTGGFSTRGASIGAYRSPLIEYIVIVFMLLAGINFARQHQLWVERRPGKFFSDVEIRAFLVLTAAATFVIALVLLREGYDLERAFRASLFQVAAIATSTGFATDDFEAWPPLPQLLLLALMFPGGCSGSTAGGLKVSRIVLLSQVVRREFRRMVERRGVFAIRMGDHVIDEGVIQNVLNLIYFSFLFNMAACLLLAAMGIDILTSISAVAACMFNIGPGLGSVGPMDNYGHLPAAAKWVLTACMIAGRLEFFTAIVVFTPSFWRR